MNKSELINRLNQYNIQIFRFEDVQLLFPNESYLATDLKRLTDNNVIERVYKGQYILLQNNLTIEEIAQKLYYPSYISFQSALFIHGIVNQGPNQIFLATTKRKKTLNILGNKAQFNHIKNNLYFGYKLEKNIFLAEPEKAICDMLYLNFTNKIHTDISDWYLKNIDLIKLEKYSKFYGKRFVKYFTLVNYRLF